MTENIVTSIIAAASAVIISVVALVTNHKGFSLLEKRMEAGHNFLEKSLQNGLTSTEKRMEAGFASVNKRLELIEARLTNIESDIKQFNAEQGSQNADIARLKDKAGIS